MAATTVSIASDSTHLDINQILSEMLARHGEGPLLASVAQAIGFRRLQQAAEHGASSKFRCDDPSTPMASACSMVEAAEPGQVITYYDAGCAGAKKLSRCLQRSIFKKGYTCQADEELRLRGLNEADYGGWAASQVILDAMNPLDGWNTWAFARHEPSDTAHIILPEGVTIERGLWRVRLPACVAPRKFDSVVTAAMMPRQLGHWITSGEGRAHCSQLGLDPNEFLRFARDDRTGVLRPVEELYVYSPRRDGHWFATILGESLAHVRANLVA